MTSIFTTVLTFRKNNPNVPIFFNGPAIIGGGIPLFLEGIEK